MEHVLATLRGAHLDKTLGRRFKAERWATVEEGNFLYDTVRENDIRCVIESGTCNGYSAAWLAAGVAANGGGKLFTFDYADREKIWSHPRLQQLDSFIAFQCVGFENADLTGILAVTPTPILWFVDGNHSRAGIQRDLDVFDRHHRVGDIVALHDIDGYAHIRGHFDRMREGRKYTYLATRRGVGAVFF